MRALLDKLCPSIVIAEPFIVRGFGSNLISLIGTMLGSLQEMADQRSILERQVMSSTWKVALPKLGFDLEKMYSEAREKGVPPHVVDAMLIAEYGRGDMSFAKLRKTTFKTNVKLASVMLPVEDRIKPKKRAKAGNVVPGGKRGRRRKVHGDKVLVLAQTRAKRVRGRGRR
jgi:hypothetical protein